MQLRGGSTANGTTTFTASNNTVTTIGPGQTIQSQIMISSDFTISSPVTLSLNIAFPTDPALMVTLLVIDPNNSSDDVTIPLFSRIGSGLSTANFTNTTFDDIAALPIQDASAPFSATYQVETGLGPGGKTVTLDSLSGRSAKATYILQISNTSSVSTDMGQLNDWSISMGAAGARTTAWASNADQSTVPFQIFVMDPTDTQSLSTWTAVGPAGSGNPTGTVLGRGRGHRDGRRSLRPLGQHRLHRRGQRRHLEDDRLPHDQSAGPDLDSADRLRSDQRGQHRLDRHLPAE